MVWEGGRLPPDPHPSLQGLGSVYGGSFPGTQQGCLSPFSPHLIFKSFHPRSGPVVGMGVYLENKHQKEGGL